MVATFSPCFRKEDELLAGQDETTAKEDYDKQSVDGVVISKEYDE